MGGEQTTPGEVSESNPAMLAGGTLPRLVELMKRLRGPGGCPWDREQTLDSLRPYVIEEAHEVAEAIDEGEASALKEELGDLLFQIVFQSELAEDKGWFDVDDVIEAVHSKMVRRHPHVFADTQVADTDDVVRNWETIKRAEKPERDLFDGIPAALPALLKAVRYAERVSGMGFDIRSVPVARELVAGELSELDQALSRGDTEAAAMELGDVLLSLTNLARKMDVDPEGALASANARFRKRVEYCRDASRDVGTSLKDLDPESLNKLWQAAKQV